MIYDRFKSFFPLACLLPLLAACDKGPPVEGVTVEVKLASLGVPKPQTRQVSVGVVNANDARDPDTFG